MGKDFFWQVYILMLLLLFFPNAFCEEVPLEVITAGIKYYDSKIKTVKFDGILDYVMASKRYRVEYVLAYEGRRAFLSLYHRQIAESPDARLADEDYTLEYVFDGERTWWIYKHILFTHYNVITGRNFPADFDPRFYISRRRVGYEKHTLDEYLVKNNAKVIGEEMVEVKQKGLVKKEPCYLVSFGRKDAKEVSNCWISKKAFRLVKHEAKKHYENSSTYKYSFTILYRQFPDDIWYPMSIEWDSSSYSTDGQKKPINIGRMILSNIEINKDVSKFFRFSIPASAEIVDFDIDKKYFASELLGRNAYDSHEAASTVKKEKKKDGMVLIPAGEFKMGSDKGNENEMPVKTVYLDAYYIDKYEVTNHQYATFLNTLGKTPEEVYHFINIESPYCKIEYVDGKYQAEQGYEDHPVLFVTWQGAKDYAKWENKRLPTEAEWEKAARGGFEGKEYPWGNTIFHDNANYAGSYGVDAWLFTAPVGSFAPNGYGLYDMAGNAWEWCADWYDNQYYKKMPLKNPKGPDSGTNRVIRGGSWGNDTRYLRCAFRYGAPPMIAFNHVGFRCAKDDPTRTGK